MDRALCLGRRCCGFKSFHSRLKASIAQGTEQLSSKEMAPGSNPGGGVSLISRLL